MKINQLHKETKEGRTSVSSEIKGKKWGGVIFFSAPEEYGQYLVDEVDDAFIYAVMLPALVNGEDIDCNNVSEHVRYHFDTIMFLFGKVFGYSPVKLRQKHVIKTDFHPTKVGTGFSGGVDSFATLINHTSDDCPESFRISQLCLFNIGSYGNDYPRTSVAFGKDLQRAKTFAQDIGMPLVDLDSNISSIYTNKDIYHYSLRSTICLSAGILALAKLFRTYLISSSGTIDDMKLNKWDMYFYENSLTQLLSTASTQICIAETNKNRVEKTKLLAENPLAQKYLYVCAADIYNEKYGGQFKKDSAPNCGCCIKCTRTLLTLDLLGALNKFSDRFDLEKYKQIKTNIVQNVLDKRSYDHFSREIYELMQEKGVRVPLWRKAYGDWRGFWKRMRFKFLINK